MTAIKMNEGYLKEYSLHRFVPHPSEFVMKTSQKKPTTTIHEDKLTRLLKRLRQLCRTYN